MVKLSVNVNKIATLRNARGGNVPNVVQTALDIEEFGADGITVHPRPDERHITYQDVQDLTGQLKTEFNIEGYPSRDWLDLVLEAKPAQATLVPDPPNVLTSNAGWNTIKHKDFLKEVLTELKLAGIRSSIFIETDQSLIEGAAEAGADRIELYTESFATNFERDKNIAAKPYTEAAIWANSCGLGINAGHDLNLYNLKPFKNEVPHLAEVSIGHALVADALYFGLENVVNMYKAQLR